jgi:hypothetical protein
MQYATVHAALNKAVGNVKILANIVVNRSSHGQACSSLFMYDSSHGQDWTRLDKPVHVRALLSLATTRISGKISKTA